MQINLGPLDMLDALIAVLLLFFFLRRFAFPPLLKAIHDRQARIESDIKAAEDIRVEAEALKRDLDQQLKDVRQRAEAAMTRALRDAEEESQQILDRARQESRRLIEEAQTEIQAERDRALSTVKAQAVELAVSVATKVLGEGLTDAQNEKLLEQFQAEAGQS
ncbi:MAG: F0F1 ATP synthase subunit B [Clostridia bacterium]